MPAFAFNSGRFKSKGKDYCTKLRKMSSFEDYYTYCSGDRMRFDGCLTYPHPMDEEDRAKWNIHARYVWANLINMLFKSKVRLLNSESMHPVLMFKNYKLDVYLFWHSPVCYEEERLSFKSLYGLNCYNFGGCYN